MAEERTLGLARAEEQTSEEPSKEELQRRLGEARDSISSTVTEIKETVANQVKAVKDTLDWRNSLRDGRSRGARRHWVSVSVPAIALLRMPRATARLRLGHRSLR